MIILDIKNDLIRSNEMTNQESTVQEPASGLVDIVLKMYLGSQTVTELVRGLDLPTNESNQVNLNDTIHTLSKRGFNFTDCIISTYCHDEGMFVYQGTMPLPG